MNDMKFTDKVKRVCWQGFEKGQCPKRRLENEKLFLGMLLTIAIGLLIWMQT